MSNCCSKNNQSHKHHICPKSSTECREVPYETILHHIKAPWSFALKEQNYYFCAAPDCDVVYFGSDNSTIHKDQLRTKVGVKEASADALVCYCFGVSKTAAKTSEQAKSFVIAQTKNSSCACTTRNPSGKCCLKDFPK